LRQWAVELEEWTGATLLEREKRRIVVPIWAASSLVTEITMEVAVFWDLISTLG
jgi:hypothetical protein